jgi:hypothetical protein
MLGILRDDKVEKRDTIGSSVIVVRLSDALFRVVGGLWWILCWWEPCTHCLYT